ncbi:MAG: hypothetical protein AB4050_14060 [Synechococcus sp.]
MFVARRCHYKKIASCVHCVVGAGCLEFIRLRRLSSRRGYGDVCLRDDVTSYAVRLMVLSEMGLMVSKWGALPCQSNDGWRETTERSIAMQRAYKLYAALRSCNTLPEFLVCKTRAYLQFNTFRISLLTFSLQTQDANPV